MDHPYLNWSDKDRLHIEITLEDFRVNQQDADPHEAHLIT